MLKLLFLILSLPCLQGEQGLVLRSGEIHSGTIAEVKENRIKFRTDSGRVLRFENRQVRYARDKDHKKTRFAAQYVKRTTTTEQNMLMAKLKSGGSLMLHEIQILTKDCNEQLVKELSALAASENKQTRLIALSSLGNAGLKGSCITTLNAAIHDTDADVRRAAVQSLMNETSVAALQAADQLKNVELGLTTKDKKSRLGFAWIGIRLGSKKAIAVLKPYIKARDHHIREEVSVLLAEYGSDSGMTALLLMLRPRESPAIKANRKASPSLIKTLKKAELREKIEVCRLLGNLGVKRSLSTLRARSGITSHSRAQICGRFDRRD